MKSVLYTITTLILLATSGTLICSEKTPPEYVIEHYIKENSFPDKGEKDIVKKERIFFKLVDANGDGNPDWYLDDPNNCGSQGCNGFIYLFLNNKYCFAGYDARHLVGTTPNKTLQCIK